jgi:hypothetical protein
VDYGISISVSVDGIPVHIAGWSIEHTADAFTSSWNIDFLEPLSLGDDATLTLERTFTTIAGKQLQKDTLLDEVPLINGQNYALGENRLVWSVNGKGEALTNSNIAPQKDIWFFNPIWLNGLVGIPSIPELPPHDADPDSYEQFSSYASHHRIAGFLAMRMGCYLVVNTPDISLQKSLHVQKTQTYFQAIEAMFAMWGPTISVRRDPLDRYPTIYIIDAAGEEQSTKNPQKLVVPLESITVVHVTEEGKKKADKLNSIEVRGATTKRRVFDYGRPSGDLTPVILSPVELSVDQTLSHTETWNEPLAKKIFGDYRRGLGSVAAAALRQERPRRTHTVDYYHIDPKNEANWIILASTKEIFSDEGVLLHRISTKHTYSDGYKLILTTETQELKLQKPGVPFKEFVKARNKIINQCHYIESINKSLTTEIIEELVLVTEAIRNGEKYYTGASSLVNAQQPGRVNADPKTKQTIIEMTTKSRSESISRVTDGVLKQETTEVDNLSGYTKVTSQIIQDPRKEKVQQGGDDSQFKANFYLTPPDDIYNKTLVIEHQDIADMPTARRIAQRAFARSGSNQTKTTLDLSVRAPIPVNLLPLTVALPDLEVLTAVGRSSWTTSISGGEYLAVGATEQCRIDGDRIEHQCSLKLRSVL